MFERAYVITLDIRQDRRDDFYSRLPSCFPDIKPFRAIHGDTCLHPEFWKAGNGAWGCYRSHLSILEQCINENVGSYVVFEDDCHFIDGFDVALNHFLESLPEDWQQAYLGGQLIHTERHPPIKINEHCYRPYNINRTHAFAVSRAGMLPLYRWLNDLPFAANDHIDHHLGRWHEDKRNKVFCPPRWLCGQMGCSSNVSGKVEPITFFQDAIDQTQDHRLLDDPICLVYRGDAALLRTPEVRALVHCGNTLDSDGYDVGLALAHKLKDPVAEIGRWYGWVRSEIIRYKTTQIPCLFHHRIEEEWIKEAGLRVVTINPKTIEEFTIQAKAIR